MGDLRGVMGALAESTMSASADPIAALQDDLRALRRELRELRSLVLELRDGLLAGQSPALQAPSAAGGAATLLARRNAERLAGEVQRRQALGQEAEADTEMDLLIDRLHDLALDSRDGVVRKHDRFG
jgi:hypothetical protein